MELFGSPEESQRLINDEKQFQQIALEVQKENQKLRRKNAALRQLQAHHQNDVRKLVETLKKLELENAQLRAALEDAPDWKNDLTALLMATNRQYDEINAFLRKELLALRNQIATPDLKKEKVRFRKDRSATHTGSLASDQTEEEEKPQSDGRSRTPFCHSLAAIPRRFPKLGINSNFCDGCCKLPNPKCLSGCDRALRERRRKKSFR
jgi:hypothetical protein